ncbi:MAG: glutamate--tRNA ligase [Bacteroidales bacterium]|nr:glutamate--tRNA ligase [Bacteroidales bacterium]
MKKVRVRFAPSPTGPLHIGGVRTALFNYLFAKKQGGDFLLRIEDTDQTRYVEGAEDYVMNSLEWIGIKVDEGIKEGGNFGPYKQSERREIYKEHIKILLNNGNAYYAFDTPEELDEMRKRLEDAGSSVRHYNAFTRKDMKNAFTMSEKKVEDWINAGKPYVIRFKMPENEELTVKDIIRGEVKVNTSQLDDKVLFKSDGLPTYHMANIVDDHLMQISHVIRGEEWLPSLPLHVLLYKSFGWENEMPQFAHLPLLLKPSGKGKLSKRDGDQLGFPVFPLEWKDPKTGDISSGYKEDGYLPEAFINMIALLGWNPGEDREIYNLEELAKKFDLTKVQKGGARFSPEKAKWFNQQYIKKTSAEDLTDIIVPLIKERGIDIDSLYIEKVTGFVKERMVLLTDFWNQAAFFFETPTEYNQKIIKKRWKEDTPEVLIQIYDILESIRDDKFTTEHTEDAVKEFINERELSFGNVLNPLRLVLTGTGGGPHLFDIISSIGKEETLKRIMNGVSKIKK